MVRRKSSKPARQPVTSIRWRLMPPPAASIEIASATPNRPSATMVSEKPSRRLTCPKVKRKSAAACAGPTAPSGTYVMVSEV